MGIVCYKMIGGKWKKNKGVRLHFIHLYNYDSHLKNNNTYTLYHHIY